MSERETGHHGNYTEEKITMVRPSYKDAGGQNTKINNGMDTDRKKEKGTPKKHVDRGGTSSHGNKELGTRSMEKQRGMELWSLVSGRRRQPL